MIDNITAWLDVPSTSPLVQNIYQHLSHLEIVPVLNPEGAIIKDRFFIRNLLVEYHSYRQQLRIKNSLHKFYHQNNYTPYTLSEVRETAGQLTECLKLDVSSAVVKSIEYGCNIPLATEAQTIYHRMHLHKDKAFVPMTWEGDIYGSICYHSHYNIKWYDKTRQTQIADGVFLPQPVLRYEIRVKNMQYLHRRTTPIALCTLKDLWNRQIAQQLMDDLLCTYDQTLKREQIDLYSLTMREKTAVARMTCPTVAQALKQHHRSTYRDDKEVYRELLERNRDAEVQLRKQLETHCTYLIDH